MLTAEAGIHSLLLYLLIQCLHHKTTLPPSPTKHVEGFRVHLKSYRHHYNNCMQQRFRGSAVWSDTLGMALWASCSQSEKPGLLTSVFNVDSEEMYVVLVQNCGRLAIRRGKAEKLLSRQDLLRERGRNNYLEILFTFIVGEMQL